MKTNKLFTPQRRELRSKFYRKGVWQRIRKYQLAKEPLCESCQKMKILKEANTCDHIDPTWETWEEFIKGPFQSLCGPCHQEKTLDDLSKLKRAEMLKIQEWE